MKYILIILITLIYSLANSQNILDDNRDPIVVETKADLQSELELLPIKYFREEKADSLLKFNYSYHARPLRSDFFLYPEKKIFDCLKFGFGSHDFVNLENYLSISNFKQDLAYLHREDKGKRKADILSLGNQYSLNNHSFSLNANYLSSSRKISLLDRNNDTQNIGLRYQAQNIFSDLFHKIEFEIQYENLETLLQDKKDYWNMNSKIELVPLENIYTSLQFSDNHNYLNSQVELYYQDVYSFGLWFGHNKDINLLAPVLNLYLNHNNITFKLTNKPSLIRNSFFSLITENLYGNYSSSKLDYFLPLDANAELSYFNFLTWSLGFNEIYALNAPVYRTENTNEQIYYDSYWKIGYFAKISYTNKNLQLSSKAELINYNNFSADYLPFMPELRLTNSLELSLSKWSFFLDYILENAGKNDFNAKLDNSHILNLSSCYQANNWLTFWSEFTNILDLNNNFYQNDPINKPEFKTGIKLFF